MSSVLTKVASAVRAVAAPPVELSESERLAKEVVERFGAPQPHWDRVVLAHRKAKGKLLALLGQERITVHDGEGEVEAAGLMDNFSRALFKLGFWVGDLFTVKSFEEDRAQANDQACCTYKVEAGTKLSRATAACLRHIFTGRSMWANVSGTVTGRKILDAYEKKHGGRPDNEQLTPIIVEEVFRQVAPSYKGTVVLSAGLLDQLLCSHHVPFLSCLDVEKGEYRAGARQYACDTHTLIAFSYQEERPCPGLGDRLYPYKTWRQHVHLDLKDRSAVFMRPYGNAVPTSVHKKLRETVARLLAKSAGHKAEGEDWYDHAVETRVPVQRSIITRSRHAGSKILASIDSPVGFGCYEIRLKDGGEFTTGLFAGWPVPCGRCATGGLHAVGLSSCC